MNSLPRIALALTLLTGTAAALLTNACSGSAVSEESEEEIRRKKDSGVMEAAADASIDASSKTSFERLSFQFGNQISGSELTIDKDGVITRTERTCCPPKFTPFPGKLGAEDLQMLADDAAQVALAGHETVDGVATAAEGSKSGSFTVSVAGKTFAVVIVARNADLGKPNVVTRTLNVTAKKRLVDRVNQLVDVDLPSNP